MTIKKSEFKPVNNAPTSQLIIKEAEVLFSNLTEATGFQGSEENKKYEITFLVSTSDAEKLEETLAAELDKAFDHYKASLPAAEARKLVKAVPPISPYTDREGNITGHSILKAKRPEKMGTPKVLVIEDGKEVAVTRNFITKGSKIAVSTLIKPYKMGSLVGLTLQLRGVKILEEKEYIRKESKTNFDLSTEDVF